MSRLQVCIADLGRGPLVTSWIVALSLCGAPSAQAAAAPAAGSNGDGRPAFAFLRQNEDWSNFQPGDGAFDALKHVPLSASGDVWASFGGRVEGRVESWDNFRFGAPNDDVFVVSRALAHADVRAGAHLRGFLELKTAQATDRDLPGGRRTLDLDTFAVQQLFVDLQVLNESSTLTLRPGRQMLSFGKQRLVSPLPWGNTLRAWDGLTAQWECGAWSVTGIATAFVPVDKTSPNDADEDELLYGVYARHVPATAAGGLEVYLLGNERAAQVVNGTAGDARRQTLGARRWGPIGTELDYEVEAALQLGEVGAGDVAAGFATAEIGWRPGATGTGPGSGTRYSLGLDWASGDGSPGGDVGTFDQLYPLGHAYFGYADHIGRQNVTAANVAATFAPAPATTLRASAHAFWLSDRSDAIYNAGGGVLRAPGGFTSSEVAKELDLSARRQVGRHLALYAGYSHVFAGQAIEDSGPSEDVGLAYFGAQFTW